MAEIVPTILTADLAEYTEKLKALEGIVNRVHIDIIDGKFVNNQTIFLDSLKNEQTNLRMDLHLMVKEPEEWVNRALEVLPDRLIGQVEMMADPLRFINETVEGGMEAGLAFDLETPLTAVSEEVLHLADMILFLSVKAGFGGQEFDRRVLDKIAAVKKIVDDLVKIGVDGGLDEKSIALCRRSGVDVFYLGHSFWQAEDLAKRYQELTSLIA
jgi:ribulose-phosphate 3-epimerase